MAETKRGRISHATYVRTVGHMLMRDWFTLDSCEILTQLEIVDQLVSAYPSRYLSPGFAVRALLDKAIDQVMAASRANADEQSHRIAQFLELRREGLTIAAVARSWGLTRECVSRKVSRQAVLLVTDRFLKLVRRKVVLKERDEPQKSATKVKQFAEEVRVKKDA